MKILFLSPQPFFQERGTPIAVRLAVEVLAAREQDSVDLVTYHEGEAVEIPKATLHRIWMPSWVRGVGPGISLKKLMCDVSFVCKSLGLAWRARKDPYHLVHAVEESVFIAWIMKLIWGVPYLYDMDSSLALQLTEKWWLLRPCYPLLSWCERQAIKGSVAVVPVCDSLAALAVKQGSRHTRVLSDISLLRRDQTDLENRGAFPNLREEMRVSADAVVSLYIGNLERYQGIDLLLASFARVAPQHPSAYAAVIGGTASHIEKYRAMARTLGLEGRLVFLGARPVASLSAYLTQASILLSPRVLGNNTPMKVYSYMHSGIPVLATNLPTHTQVLHSGIAKLADPTPEAFSQAWGELLSDPVNAKELGRSAKALAEERYTFQHFERTLNSIYDLVQTSLSEGARPQGASS